MAMRAKAEDKDT